MSSPTVVLFPTFGLGHMVPMAELAKVLTDAGVSVTVPFFKSPFNPPAAVDAFISGVNSTHPSISFHLLPDIPLPPNSLHLTRPTFDAIKLGNPILSDFIRSKPQVVALVVDIFSTCALDVGKELSIPTYLYFSSGATAIVAFIMFSAVQSQIGCSLKDHTDPVHFPSLPSPVPASYYPMQLHDRHGEMYDFFSYNVARIATATGGIIVSTFDALEPRAVTAIAEGKVCDVPLAPVYRVGLMIGNWGDAGAGGQRHECLAWLDAQPKRSVVYLCFGSMGALSAAQLKEIAVALDRSGQRFIWVVRSPTSVAGKRVTFGQGPDPDLNALMPEGFLERTEGRGLVVKNWAPQSAVMAHESVGAFVTHCGWGSITEAVYGGVPMIAWPLYAEQRLNMAFLVEEAKLALGLKGFADDVVGAEEIEGKVRLLMESEEGKEIMERVAAMREKAMAARAEGGSSDKALQDLLRRLK